MDFSKLTVRSCIVMILVVGGLALAIVDAQFRPTFGDLAKIAIGGYLGQMLPESKQ